MLEPIIYFMRISLYKLHTPFVLSDKKDLNSLYEAYKKGPKAT